LSFDNIYSISQGDIKNQLEITIWNANFFRRKIDAITIEAFSVLVYDLPRQLD